MRRSIYLSLSALSSMIAGAQAAQLPTSVAFGRVALPFYSAAAVRPNCAPVPGNFNVAIVRA